MTEHADPTLVAVEHAEPFYDEAERTVREVFAHPWLDVTWSRYDAGERGPDPHIHREHVDGFYVLEGELGLRVGPEGEPVVATAGTLVLVPPGVVHAFDNESDGTTRWLNFHAPSTGFVAWMRGGTDGWDSEDPPADGGRSAEEAVVMTAAGGERLERSNGTLTVLGNLSQLSVIEMQIEPGWTVPPHEHVDEVDSFFVLEGEVEFTVGDDTVVAGPVTGSRRHRGRVTVSAIPAPPR